MLSFSETNGHPMKSPLTNFLNPMNKTQSSKGHHRTCSSPVKFSPVYEKSHQENPYVHVAPKVSDPDSPSENSYQHTFINSKILHENPTQDVRNEK